MTEDFSAPCHKTHRKWAICHGGVRDHRGKVQVSPLADFDLNQTIFGSVKGFFSRMMTERRLGQTLRWDETTQGQIDRDFQTLRHAQPPKPLDPALLTFLREHCDFNAEHADGSFWEHLYFGYEYCLHHYPEHSARVMLLHSILGTGTNTFAMKAEQIPNLERLLTPFEWKHIEVFPSVLRLLYHQDFTRALAKMQRSEVAGLECSRVIDNAPITIDDEALYIQLNYQLMHLADFLPVANWYTQKNDPSFLVFRELYALLRKHGELKARLEYDPELRYAPSVGAIRPWKGRWMDHIPGGVIERFGARAMENFSRQIGHSLDFRVQRRS